MFSTENGSPRQRKHTWRALRRAIVRANEHLVDKMPIRNVHSLRHGFASLLLARKTPLPEVCKLMGHANPQITLMTYSHFMTKEATFNANAFFNVSQPSTVSHG
jgi:integrase